MHTLVRVGKLIGFVSLFADIAILVYSAWYVKLHVKDPLQSAYVFNYVMTFLMCIMLIPVSFPGTPLKKAKFAKLDSEPKIGPAIIGAWYLSLGTFIITDPMFSILREGKDDDDKKTPFILFVCGAVAFALAGAVIIAGAVVNTKEAAAGGGGGAAAPAAAAAPTSNAGQG
ncbi:hypothetical protein LPJ56_000928 [Coemansia sp. RSA 2599]|nr:hypothetical protein LPJ75_000518 [Coemansia sp. RSA 2598]KAJ1828723.1 hypothetical protein LPJ56_000928 [Coemansia sp. RSA 2599]